jgi:hypothetical protein
MNSSEHLLKRLHNDIGGLPSEPFKRVERQLEPWERCCHALADVLDYHKIISTEEKRRGVEVLGGEIVGQLSYFERWVAAFANNFVPEASADARGPGSQHGRGGAAVVGAGGAVHALNIRGTSSRQILSV